VQEAPPGSLGSVTAFRTTTGQLGFALGFAALSSGVLSHPQATPSKAIAVIADAYATGLGGTMLVVALLVALLVIGRQQGGAQG
jgi:hypothetical protein